MKKIVMGLSLILILVGCTPKQTDDTKIKVVTSFYPLYDFATKIGGDRVTVTNLVEGGDPHHYEPSPKDMAKVTEANLFVYNGAGLEHWVGRLINAIDGDNVTVVEASEGLDLHDESEHDDHDHDHDDHNHGGVDPHVWMRPAYAQHEAKRIADALIAVDPLNKSFYESNFQALEVEFQTLQKEFDTVLTPYKGRTVMVDHQAYGYLLEPYEIEQAVVKGSINAEEPTIMQLQQAISMIRDESIRSVFMQTNGNQKMMDILKKETGVAVYTLNTLELMSRKDLETGHDYFALMRENLKNLGDGIRN